MNRLDFIGQTHQGSFMSVDDIIQFFDHTIAAYELVEDIENASIHSIPDNLHSSLRIKIESPDLSKLNDMVAYINNTIHNRKTTYGKNFIIDATIEGDSVTLFVREYMA